MENYKITYSVIKTNENKVYVCPNCKSILVVPKNYWFSTMKCTVCDKELRLLDDEFDLSEIIEENK